MSTTTKYSAHHYHQTKEIRTVRAKLGKGKISEAEYNEFIKKEIELVVKFQEKVGLDLFVHSLNVTTCYVRPPTIVSDITSRLTPMTVKWSSYKPMKGILSGPVTILNWFFPRDDRYHLALALRDEVLDLEKADISAIQVDEPAISEGVSVFIFLFVVLTGMSNLQWAVDTFKLSTATHSHFCYSDFGDIFPSIQRLDANVISIEFLKTIRLSNQIGPGVYDIHSPRIPSEAEIIERLKTTLAIIPDHLMFINPDCGLKTRGWKETDASLANLVATARWARANA
ncbi:cobalamin-independent synthase [Suillus tomentosus]|nr:cobalamin-independent synthase [Suillus tomentosus]